jgi:molybdopterin molybdotransferase
MNINKMIPLDEALKLVTGNVHSLNVVRVKLEEALGYVSAIDIVARYPNPRFDNSSMDGYAVISGDLANASRTSPILLEVVEDLPAGKSSQRTLNAGQAARIMTGAPVPAGTDAVVMVEETERSGRNVKIFHAPKAGEYIRFAGDDIKEGEIIVSKGKTIGPAEIMAFAGQGITEIDVIRRPRVAILATGDELISPGGKITEGHIFNSSSVMLAALVHAAGGIPIDLGIAPDDPKIIEEKICGATSLRAQAKQSRGSLGRGGFSLPHEATKVAPTLNYNCQAVPYDRARNDEPADMLLITGGVSVGDYDYNRNVLEKLGWKDIFWRVAIKPGKPLAFGLLNEKPVFGMPGNPISTMTVFELFVRPAIRKMMGSTEPDSRRLTAELANNVERDAKREQLLLGNLYFKNGKAYVTAKAPQSSAHMKPALNSNCLARIPSGEGILKSSEIIEVWPLIKVYKKTGNFFLKRSIIR